MKRFVSCIAAISITLLTACGGGGGASSSAADVTSITGVVTTSGVSVVSTKN